jgi:hypothetical protein
MWSAKRSAPGRDTQVRGASGRGQTLKRVSFTLTASLICVRSALLLRSQRNRQTNMVICKADERQDRNGLCSFTCESAVLVPAPSHLKHSRRATTR